MTQRGNWKLTVSRLWEAWREYPRQRREIASIPPGPPIFVTGTHRSGTTWVAKMLAVPGLWYVHEPFNPNKGVWKESFTYAPPDRDRRDIDRYFSQLLQGEFRRTADTCNTEHWLMPMRLFRPPIRRLMIKDPLACLLTGYLSRRFDLRTLVLFRHPAGFVSSVTRLGWPIAGFLRSLLTCPNVMDEHLSPYSVLMEKYQDRDDVPSAAVLHGVLNTVLWNQRQTDSRLAYYCFEELCQSPLDSFRHIFQELDLPYTDKTVERHAALCLRGSDSPSDYHPHAVARNSKTMADSWRRQLSARQVWEIRKIWEQFSIPLYSDDRQWRMERPITREQLAK